MWTALLAPFGADHRARHQLDLVDQYYANLTRESLQSLFRSDLRDASKRQGLQTQLGRTFNEYAITDESGRRVWTQEQLRALLSSHLGNSEPLTVLLWRCLIYNARFPFATPPGHVATLDSEAWMQAAALLATDTSRDFSRNRATVSLYEGSSPSSRKKCTWRRFVSLASDAQHTAQTSINDNWHPPDSLEEVAMVVSTQLPLDLKTKIPAYHDIQPKIRKLKEETSRTSEAVNRSIGVPYREFVSFLTAIMSIRHPGTATDGSGEERSWPEIDPDADGDVVDALVRAILERGGLHAEGKDVGFEEYSAFCDRYSSPTFSFDAQISSLWQALLFSPIPRQPQDHPLHQQQGAHPPTALLQALTFLSPFDFDLQQSKLDYTSSHIAPTTHADVVKALTKPYCPKLVVVHGVTTAPNDGDAKGETALFTILTSSPLWCAFEGSSTLTLDFKVGEDHHILEMAPRARGSQYANAEARFRDIVEIAGAALSFGRPLDEATTSSGLTLDFAEGTATIVCPPGRPGQSGRRKTYIGIEAGPQKRAPGRSGGSGAEEGWRETIRMQRVEVYNVPGGVAEDLEVER